MGLTPVCCGSLMTPILIFGLDLKPHLAIGTDLLFAAFTKLGGIVSLERHRSIDWRVLGQVALGSVPACLVSLYVPQQLGTSLIKKLWTASSASSCPSCWPAPDSN